MVTVKNLTSSPYDLQSTEGVVRLPAFGEATADFADDYLQLLEASMAVEIVESRAPAKPKKAADSVLTKLRTDKALTE